MSKKKKTIYDEDVMKTIDIVINRIAPKYTFNGYDVDDIKQESYIICLEAMDRYDQDRPLENFLSVNLSNRLKNFIRDNFGNAKDIEKKKVNCPVNIQNNEHYIAQDDLYSKSIEDKEIYDIIDSNIPSYFREDFLKFVNGVYINKNRRIELLEKIKEILNEKG